MSVADQGWTEIDIRAPSRLHFGLLSFDSETRPRFGGVGAMVDQPGIRIRVRPSPHFSVTGIHQRRALEFSRRYLAAIGGDTHPRCHVDVVAAPDHHVGLGTGTQLALSVVTGLSAFLGRDRPSVEVLATSTDRGYRSSVGSHGFRLGGLLLDEGKVANQRLARVADRMDVPDHWRWLLICPRDEIGLSGAGEQRAFDALPPVPSATTDALIEEVRERLFPAVRAADATAFGDSLYKYGVMAGRCFATEQAGSFASERIQRIVDRCRALGVHGVGQSSWGPTIFTLFESETAAGEFRLRFEDEHPDPSLHWTLATPNNVGVRVSIRQRHAS